VPARSVVAGVAHCDCGAELLIEWRAAQEGQ